MDLFSFLDIHDTLLDSWWIRQGYKYVRTPPGVDPKEFEIALFEWQKIIGEQWVFTGTEDVDLYRDAYTPFRNEAL